MALIKCSECGKEVSDKAVCCPGCGCPVGSSANESVDLGEVIKIYRHSTDGAIRYIVRTYGIDKEIATEMVLNYYNKILPEQDPELYEALIMEKTEIENREIKNTKKQERREAFYNWCEKTRADSRTPKCPKCKSTSITYTNKKLSIGRTIVGGAILGAPGAVLGGLSSKKGYAVCLNCGKRWKL
jgi:Zn finger protein HypA/HybF involved in hydrogenase expression